MEESYVSLAELKVILEKEKAVRGELNPEQQYSLSHAALFARVPGRGGRVQTLRARAERGRNLVGRAAGLHRQGYRHAQGGAPREATRRIRGAHDRRAEGTAICHPGDGEGEGGEVRRLLQSRAGDHHAVPHARTVARPWQEDDVGDPRGAQEGSIQIVPGSRSARTERPSS